MANIFNYNFLHHLVAYSTIITFTSSLVTPSKAYSIQININEADFALKIKKLKENIFSAASKKDINKLISCAEELKKEIEKQTGTKININKKLDEVQEYAKLKGYYIENKHIACIKKIFSKKNKAIYSKNMKPYEQEQDVPGHVMVGVVVTLCGLFLYIVPNPATKVVGKYLLELGNGILTGCAIDKFCEGYDENRRKVKNP